MRARSRIAAALFVLLALPGLFGQASEGYVRQLMSRGDYREAVAALEDIETRTTLTASEYQLLIRADLRLGRMDKALGACQSGMARIDSATLDNSCVALLRSTRPRAEVEKTLIDALNSRPESPVLQKAVARMLYEDNPEDERAGALLAAAAHQIPDDAEVHFFFGQWLCMNQREPACIEELTIAADKTEPANHAALAQIWSLLATAHANMGELDRASEAWDRARQANDAQKEPSAWLTVQYAQYLRQLGRFSEAEAMLRGVLSHNPDFGPAHLELAELAFRKHNPEAAAREAKRALACAGFDARDRQNIHWFLSSVYASTGLYADADRERALARE